MRRRCSAVVLAVAVIVTVVMVCGRSGQWARLERQRRRYLGAVSDGMGGSDFGPLGADGTRGE